ncbi:MAG: hypothetical protein AAGA91_19290 [Pseudomonadota bacterium]
MRVLQGLAIGVFALAGAAAVQADDTASVMCEQFAISGAARSVVPVTTFDADFSPPHHSPRNIPIEVILSDNVEEYVHFPIVQDGTYVLYSPEPDRFVGFKMKDGTSLKATTLPAPEACSDLLKGGMTVEITTGELTGPLPIAVELKKGPAGTVRFIVSRDPIN